MSSKFSLYYHIPASPHFSLIVVSIFLFLSYIEKKRGKKAGERERHTQRVPNIMNKEHWRLYDLASIWTGRSYFISRHTGFTLTLESNHSENAQDPCGCPLVTSPSPTVSFSVGGKLGWIDSRNWDPQLSPPVSHPRKGWLFPLSLSKVFPSLAAHLNPGFKYRSCCHSLFIYGGFLECSLSSRLAATVLH